MSVTRRERPNKH